MKKYLLIILILFFTSGFLYAAKETINNGETGLVTRNKLNSNFTELYDGVTRDSVQMNPISAPAHSEALFYYDSTTKTFTVYNEEPDIALQVGQEGWIRVYNDTGGAIADGKICYLSGETTGGLTVDLAIANDATKCLGTIGWATHSIEDGTWGYITRWGLLNNQNTLGETTVSKLWLSSTSEGDYTTTPPTSPSYLIGVGTMGIISETVGTIDVTVSIGTNTAGVIKIFNGAVLEDTATSVASTGGVVTLSYEQSGTGDLSLFFNGGFEAFDTTPAATIVLTEGSDISPTLNYVYIPESTMILTVSTVGFPAEQHVPVATALVQDGLSVETDGLYKLHAWTDHLSDSEDQGHLAHVNHWIREQHATWKSGAAPTTTVTVNGGAIDNVDFAVTSAVVLQLHDHAFPAIDTATTGHIYAINDDTTTYLRITDLSTIAADSTGASLRSNNTYYSLVIWGVVSEASGDSQLYLNEPSGFYITSLGATNDANGYSNYTIPSDFKGTGFLIARVTLRYQTADSGTLTEIETEDLRGLIPSTSPGGGGVSGGTEFSDNLFRIQNVSDITKQIDFDASPVTTGNTRTILMADQDIDLTPGVTYGAAGVGGGDLKADGTVPLTANWVMGAFDIGSTGTRINKGWFEDLTVTNGLFVGAVSDPKYETSDSDAAVGSSKFFGNSSGSFDVVMSFGVEDSTGESTVYFDLDGVNERLNFYKNTVLQAGDIELAELATDSVDYTKTTGSYKSLTPMTGDADDFLANFTGANLYGGTYICNGTGTAVLPAVTAGMNFSIKQIGAILVIIDPNASDSMQSNGVQQADGENLTNLSTAHDMAVIRYLSAAGWLVSTNGWTAE